MNSVWGSEEELTETVISEPLKAFEGGGGASAVQ